MSRLFHTSRPGEGQGQQERHGHPHAPPDSSDALRRLGWILWLSLGLMVVEALGGWFSGSLALLADAGHMFSDSAAILFSLAALRLARRVVTRERTFGFRRAEFLAAFVNAIGLVALAAWIVAEAVERVGNPRPVLSGVMLWVALAGLAVNLAGLWLLRGHTADNINLRSALWHIAGDLLGSGGAVAAALVIRWSGWTPIDPLVGIGIALLIGVAGVRILYDSANLLMDPVPAEIDAEEVRRFLVGWPGVRTICDLHIWGVSSSENMLTAHLVVEPQTDRERLLGQLLSELRARFRLAHMTVQLEGEPHPTCSQEW